MTMAVSGPTAPRRAAASPNGTNSTGPISGSKLLRYFGPNVIDRAPMVLPWYAPRMATTLRRPVNLRAILRAASAASAPLLFRCACPRPAGASATSRSRNASRSALYSDGCTVTTLSSCLLTAATTPGWRWPTSATPYPAMQSMYSFPDSSHTREPSALATLTGNLW